MKSSDRIYVAGHRGMVGTALTRRLKSRGYTNLITRSHRELDLCDARRVEALFQEHRPHGVIVAAARVGGIFANATYPADFIYENLSIALNIIHAAYQCGVERLLYLGSSCIYPRNAPQPMREDSLLTGPLEKTNEAYAFAKIGGLKLCQHFRRQYGVQFHSMMPTNLYGPGDRYHPENSHVIPALIRKFHEAKERSQPEVTLWGSGEQRREFLHVEDLAEAILHLIRVEDPPDWVNVGFGKDLSIRELAELIRGVVGYSGEIRYDTSRPDGPPQKLLDISWIKRLGWQPRIGLEEGLKQTYRDFVKSLRAETLREA